SMSGALPRHRHISSAHAGAHGHAHGHAHAGLPRPDSGNAHRVSVSAGGSAGDASSFAALSQVIAEAATALGMQSLLASALAWDIPPPVQLPARSRRAARRYAPRPLEHYVQSRVRRVLTRAAIQAASRGKSPELRGALGATVKGAAGGMSLVSLSTPASTTSHLMAPNENRLTLAQRVREEAPAASIERGEVRWRTSSAVPACMHCGTRFSLMLRKHHCRGCGAVVCDQCTPYKTRVHQRLCRACNALQRGSVLSRASPDTESFLEAIDANELAEVEARIAWGQAVNVVSGCEGITPLHAAVSYFNAYLQRVASGDRGSTLRPMPAAAVAGANTRGGAQLAADEDEDDDEDAAPTAHGRRSSTGTEFGAPSPQSSTFGASSPALRPGMPRSAMPSPGGGNAGAVRTGETASPLWSPVFGSLSSPSFGAPSGGASALPPDLAPLTLPEPAERPGALPPASDPSGSMKNDANFRAALAASEAAAKTMYASLQARTNALGLLGPHASGSAAGSASSAGGSGVVAALPQTELPPEVERNGVGIVRLLISHGASVNVAAHSGLTPLHAACMWGTGSAVQLLLDAGALQARTDVNGFTAYDCALLRVRRVSGPGCSLLALRTAQDVLRRLDAKYSTGVLDRHLQRLEQCARDVSALSEGLALCPVPG
ncbi:hypothetical protein EON68_01130, partial [archaeon]